ncbi:beta-ketoacyl-ACP synthase II [Zooshikella marina]|uniref:beta-ketoacyl-ACP synthase II n=1 Tax=Zooshikella ganghwensis TaxID=202772 RepID=UPI001BB084F8|nr:beta-ketoacyl-ACP synthase II [Zooshikella ganghwensis]MBU2705198.1 beta-ketoacyl-ACP synthase II [Zooshikella ganghwensis]
MSRRRVVVTGLGLISPLGNDVESCWQNILAGKSGISPVEHLDVPSLNTRFAGMVNDFDIETYMSAKEARKVDVFIQYGIAAASQAIYDAKLSVSTENAHRIGVAIGSGIGGLSTIERNAQVIVEAGARRISPFFVPGSVINMVSGQVSMRFGLKGPNYALATACTTGTHCLGMAARNIMYGEADVMVAGGAEKASCALGMAAFGAARALSTRNDSPQQASRPWDKDRDGFVLSDGAGVLVLEELEHAKRRGAKIYAELTGFGMSGDAFHVTAPPEDGEGAAFSMKNALLDAQLNPEDIDYINAHGTSTPVGDIAETRAVKSVFAGQAYKLAISSTKSMTGHLLGAAGAVEALFTVLSLHQQIAPPTINLDNPDDECDLDYVPHHAKPLQIRHAISNSFGFGGTNGTLVFSRSD